MKAKRLPRSRRNRDRLTARVDVERTTGRRNPRVRWWDGLCQQFDFRSWTVRDDLKHASGPASSPNEPGHDVHAQQPGPVWTMSLGASTTRWPIPLPGVAPVGAARPPGGVATSSRLISVASERSRLPPPASRSRSGAQALEIDVVSA